jgi:hypothetical protein
VERCTPNTIDRSRLARRFPRRSLLTGGLGLCSLSLPLWHAATERTAGLPMAGRLHAAERSAESVHSLPGRAKRCVFIFLFGGPSHLDLWDLKPHAPREIRGQFQPIATSTPGVEISELLPRLAEQSHRYCLVRSMTHQMPVHGPACSEIYTGRPYFGPPVTDQATPEDWPSLSALVQRYGPLHSGLASSIVLPWYTQFVGQDRRIAGQTGGRMGEEFNPLVVEGNPTDRQFRLQGVDPLPGQSPQRLDDRRRLLAQLQALPAAESASHKSLALLDRHYAAAYALLERAQSAGAFELYREPDAVRARYGWSRFGQSLLAARRLVEAGVSLVTVNWDDDSRTDKVSPHWDTHHDNFRRLQELLCPPFDQGLSAFLADLDDRGLLEETLVVALGEFGRTPRIGLVTQNGMTEPTGRDHWPHAFTAVLAGGGIRGGQVYGATNAVGGFVADRPVTPADLSATVLAHLGIDPRWQYHDHFQRVSRSLSEGNVLRDLG